MASNAAPLPVPMKPVRFWHLLVVTVPGTVLALGLAFLALKLTGRLFVIHRRPDIYELLDSWSRVRFYQLNIANAVAYTAYFAVLTGMARLTTTKPLRAYFAPVPLYTIALSLLAGVGTVLLSVAIGWAVMRLWGVDLEPHNGAQKAMLPTKLSELALSILSIGVIGPLAEEFFFHGLMLRWLLKRLNMAVAVGISALVFALVHGTLATSPGAAGWYGLFDIMFIGVLLAVITLRTGSLWPSFALHCANNSAIAIASILPLSL